MFEVIVNIFQNFIVRDKNKKKKKTSVYFTQTECGGCKSQSSANLY